MIKQVFHLPKQLNKEIDKSDESQIFQLKIAAALRLIKQQCKFDLANIELINIERTAQQISQEYNRAIIIGIGGAMLASRAFTASQNYASEDFSLIYSDSLTAQKQSVIFTKENLQNSAIIIISRSGNSIETISQTYMAIEQYRQYFGTTYELGKHFFILTKGDNKLSKIGQVIGARLLEYTSNTGKFASFSMTGLLPARLIGLNPEEIILSARKMLAQPVHAIQAAKVNYHLLNQGYSINVMSYYNDLFDQLSLWHINIASEIIAKQGKGFTPIAARGIFDQHGLWQLLLAGKRDKYFTFLLNNHNKQTINPFNLNIETTYHQLTLKRLKKYQMPARELFIDEINSKTLGSLTMQLLIELVVLANLLDVSPLSQPFIDQNKKIMSHLMCGY